MTPGSIFNLGQYLRYSGFTRIDQKSTGLSGNFDKSAEERPTDKKK